MSVSYRFDAGALEVRRTIGFVGSLVAFLFLGSGLTTGAAVLFLEEFSFLALLVSALCSGLGAALLLGYQEVKIRASEMRLRSGYYISYLDISFAEREVSLSRESHFFSERAARHSEHGTTYVWELYVAPSSGQQAIKVFELPNERAAEKFIKRVSNYIGSPLPEVMPSSAALGDTESDSAYSKHAQSVAAVLFFVFAAGATAFPDILFSLSSTKIPEGVTTYQKDGMTCWDKTTCCDESDESSCVTIPTCVMNR